MNLRTLWPRVAAGAVLLAAAIFPVDRTLSAQEVQLAAAARIGRVPVLVALVDEPRGGAGTVIIRRRNARGGIQDVIVVKRDAAAPSRISAAAVTLAAIMADEGDDAKTSRRIRIPDAATGPSAENLAAARVAKKAADAPLREVDGIGRARTTIIYLPDASLRAKRARDVKVWQAKRVP